MQNFPALGAPPPDPRASGGWGFAPKPPKQLPHCKFLATRLIRPINIHSLFLILTKIHNDSLIGFQKYSEINWMLKRYRSTNHLTLLLPLDVLCTSSLFDTRLPRHFKDRFSGASQCPLSSGSYCRS